MSTNLLFRNLKAIGLLTLVTAGCDSQSTVSEVSMKGPTATTASTTVEPIASAPTAEPKVDLGTAGKTFYFVDHYDAKRDPSTDLAEACARAKSENKRVLVQVGGEWCGWCKLMSKYMETNEAVNANLTKHFLVMKVTYEDGQKNEAFLSKYPAINGYPHLFVIDADGKLLHSQETGSLEQGKGYDQEKFLGFLDTWKPL